MMESRDRGVLDRPVKPDDDTAVVRMKRSEIRGRYQDSRIALRYIRATNFAQIHVVPASSRDP
jgi:hypothetical protein